MNGVAHITRNVLIRFILSISYQQMFAHHRTIKALTSRMILKLWRRSSNGSLIKQRPSFDLYQANSRCTAAPFQHRLSRKAAREEPLEKGQIPCYCALADSRGVVYDLFGGLPTGLLNRESCLSTVLVGREDRVFVVQWTKGERR